MDIFKRNYANLLVKVGVNIKKNQDLVISSPVDCAEFSRLIAEEAYKAGAREVIIDYNDEYIFKLKLESASEEAFEDYEDWRVGLTNHYIKKDAAFIILKSETPDLFKNVDMSRMIKFSKVAMPKLDFFRSNLMSNQFTWCIASLPTVSWAEKVFPNEDTKTAIKMLWKAIFKAVRVDQSNYLEVWEKHLSYLNNVSNQLTNHQFKYLKMTNALGTDVTIELPNNHIWRGPNMISKNGRTFVANIPSEEVNTVPNKFGVDGKIVGSRPMIYNGVVIEDFYFVLKSGKIIEAFAEHGHEALQSLLDTDEGARYLGEVAIVPNETPLSSQNILFYNTLYDENTGCHLALGQGAAESIVNGKSLTDKELSEHGVNRSTINLNFTIGTADLSVIGINDDGSEIHILNDGIITMESV